MKQHVHVWSISRYQTLLNELQFDLKACNSKNNNNHSFVQMKHEAHLYFKQNLKSQNDAIAFLYVGTMKFAPLFGNHIIRPCKILPFNKNYWKRF